MILLLEGSRVAMDRICAKILRWDETKVQMGELLAMYSPAGLCMAKIDDKVTLNGIVLASSLYIF